MFSRLSGPGKLAPPQVIQTIHIKAIYLLQSGIIATALKGDVADSRHVAAASESMMRLNRGAAQIMRKAGVHACTDITGFALLGHAYEMAEESSVKMRLRARRIPFLEGSREYAENWFFPVGTYRNSSFYRKHVEFSKEIPEELQTLLFTPETSGGLLFSAAKGNVDELSSLFADRKEDFWVIGEVTHGCGIEVIA